MLHNLSPMIPCVRGNLSQFLIYRIFFGFVLKLFACDFIWKVPKSYRRSNLICVDDFFFVIFTVTSLILFYCIVCMLYLYSLIFCFLAYNSFIDPACSCISPFFLSQNMVEESIWPMLAKESLKALGGLGLLSLAGKFLLRRVFEVCSPVF